MVIRAREGSRCRAPPTLKSNASLAPGMIPEPVRVDDQPARRSPPRTAAGGRATKTLSSPGHRNPVSIVLARVR